MDFLINPMPAIVNTTAPVIKYESLCPWSMLTTHSKVPIKKHIPIIRHLLSNFMYFPPAVFIYSYILLYHILNE